MKLCKRCGLTKPTDEFHKNKSVRDGLMAQCKQCNSERAKEWHAKNPRKRHGLDGGKYEILFESQGKACAACGDKDGPFHIDHDHACCDKRYSCGKCVRGILCHRCNVALGAVRDSQERLAGLVSYLGRVG